MLAMRLLDVVEETIQVFFLAYIALMGRDFAFSSLRLDVRYKLV